MGNENPFEIYELEDGGIQIEACGSLVSFTEEDAKTLALRLNSIFALRQRDEQGVQGKDIA